MPPYVGDVKWSAVRTMRERYQAPYALLGAASDLHPDTIKQRASREKWAKPGREPTPMTADYNKAVREHDIDLAIVDGEVVGLIETWPWDDHLWIENVAVHPSRQGAGIGLSLLARAEMKAAHARLGAIRLQTNEAFEANIVLYAALGYTIERREPFRSGTTVFMSKELTEATGRR